MVTVSLPENSLISYPLCVIGRASKRNNSYKDFIILELLTTVVAKWAASNDHLYCVHSNDGNVSLINRNKISKLLSNTTSAHGVLFIPEASLENGVVLSGDPRHD